MKKQIEAILGNAIFAALGLISFVLLSRNLAPTLFGTWVLFLSVSTFIDQIRFGLTRNATIRLIAGTEHETSHTINGAGLKIDLVVLILISTISLSLWAVGRKIFSEPYELILLWYPLVGISNTLWNNALTWFQSHNMYRRITLLRVVNIGSFLLILSLLIYTDRVTVQNIIISYVVSNTLCSFVSLIRGWSSIRYIRHSSRTFDAQILDFGKYSTVSNIGSSLLKSADSFIIALSPALGTTAVAIYAIPFKLVEMFELPIRSIATVGYNRLSQAIRDKETGIRRLFVRHLILMILLTLPVILFVVLFPDLILNILGGSQYASHFTEMRLMLYVLMIYGIMLIPDRLTGVLFEALGTPKLNTIKILAMAAANIIGDLIAVFYFESLLGVVFATVIFVMLGVVIGYRMTPVELRPRIKDFKSEFRNIPQRWRTILSKRKFK